MEDVLDILVILDRSGSMQDAKSDHEGGLKSFVEDQKELEGDVRFTLVQFDSTNPCEIVYDRVPIADVSKIQLIPRGGTPLHDAIGKAVSHLRAKNPKQVIAMVITDGENNDSKEWTKDRVQALVKELETKNWNFLFLGANVDAFSDAGGLGMNAGMAANYVPTPDSINAVYAISSSKLGTLRSSRSLDISESTGIAAASSLLNFTDDERSAISGSGTVTSTLSDRLKTFKEKKHGTVSGDRNQKSDSKTEA